jgi:hypothetical protein
MHQPDEKNVIILLQFKITHVYVEFTEKQVFHNAIPQYMFYLQEKLPSDSY